MGGGKELQSRVELAYIEKRNPRLFLSKLPRMRHVMSNFRQMMTRPPCPFRVHRIIVARPAVVSPARAPRCI